MAAPAPPAPPQPAPPQYAPPGHQMRNGLGIAALCCGLVGFLIGFIPFLFLGTGVLAILAIVFGIVGIRRVGRREASNRGMAITGLTAGVIALGLAIAGFVGTVSGLNQLSHDLDQSTNSAPASHAQAQRALNQQETRMLRQGLWIGNG